ncbi:hypothetical protein K470DRAFT_220239 [Piedraia hortae CBS 480.64]|uniref:M-phase inducer phosphatase n=1 Tax=Piedraia hortae CBS 480.64 TaxID=1314780 RepID=A0A6A7BUI5_9PEZI|nr:hypothetical protein K470DRAFT_220239 [Piedraia hortae CBS 480.64]
MDYSSPLAAMHPPPCPAWANRKDLPMCRQPAASSFNFRDMSMHQSSRSRGSTATTTTTVVPRPDYFSIRPLRASSPTASLTADLDANFHIDKSPQVPTPRRALFTKEAFGPRNSKPTPLQTPPTEMEVGGTPDIPSSSPCMMDISPLPHKLPYSVSKICLASPSRETKPDDTERQSAKSEVVGAEDKATRLPAMPVFALGEYDSLAMASSCADNKTRRRRVNNRPVFSRTKTVANPSFQRPLSAESPLPPFRFGSVATHGLASSSTPSLLETCVEAPTPDSKSSDGSMTSLASPYQAQMPMQMPTSRRLSANGSRNSPNPSHVRKHSAGRPVFMRPQRKLMRRSFSMFQHPDDVMKEESDVFTRSPGSGTGMDIDPITEHTCLLPHFASPEEPDGLPRISQDTMADVLEAKYSHQYDDVKVVDCRFEYEYQGGHIQGATNFNDKLELTNELFRSIEPRPRTLLIFHCEYSVHRAPLMAKFIRSHDRNVNAANYPRLTYPEMYILDGGYSGFYKMHRSKCYPQNYVEMNDERHEQACELGLARVKGRQKLFRAQTFAFGQSPLGVDDSPTAHMRPGESRCRTTFSLGTDIAYSIGSSYQRRMATS